MDIRLRLLTAEIALLTAVATLFNTQSPEWTKVYERRLYAEMALNLWRGGDEQKTSEKRDTGTESVPALGEKTVDSSVIHKEHIKRTSEDDAAFSEDVYCEAKMAADLQCPTSEIRETYEALNEQTAEKEILEESNIVSETLERIQPAAVPEPVGTVQKAAPVASDPESYVCSVSCNGDALDAGVSEYLKRRLTEAGIGWFFPYACAIAYQESSFNCLAVNKNMRDYGLFQFRIEFHADLEWQNPYAQVDLFTAMMASRAAAGCDVYTMISRHLMSDYGPYNQQYVDLVLSHLPKLQGVW